MYILFETMLLILHNKILTICVSYFLWSVSGKCLQRLRETTPTENSRLEGFRWQPNHQVRVLWANNLHILNQAIKETSTKKNQTDSRLTTFGMKRKTKIGIWNIRTLWEEKERAGVKLSSWPEIGSDGDVLLTPYVPKGITGYDNDDDVLGTRSSSPNETADSPQTSGEFKNLHPVMCLWYANRQLFQLFSFVL